MCGIAGYCSTDGHAVPRERIEPMLNSLRHRGPDGFGIYFGMQCVLGHARLSIIDLEGGWQPITNEDENVVITFNGEIYNYVELRGELETMGHRFRTRSDTEVVVHGYEEWGIDCPKRFNGQFAFAIFDARNRSLFLCRDRFGVRPLYYAWGKNSFVFGSEIKAILASGEITPEFCPNGLHQIYSLWTNVAPRTSFSNVFELPPSHRMLLSGERVESSRYWEMPLETDESLTTDDCVEGILHHLKRSVRLRLRADVPVGAYLSGGLDSALTTTLIRMWTRAPLKTFSLEFEDPRFDESEYQEEMVRFLGTDHSSIRCGSRDVVEHFDEVIRAVEKPVLRTASVPMFLLARLVRSQGYKVVITGEGADEFFGGYEIFKEAKIREFCSRQPGSKLRPLLLRRLYPYLFSDARTAKFQEAFFIRHFRETRDPFYGHRLRWELCGRIKDFYSSRMADRLKECPEESLRSTVPPPFASLSIGKRTQLVEIQTLLSGYLLSSQGDRVSMAHSVEGRYAFLDHEMVEFASRIPERRMMPGLREKYLLKRIGQSILPEKILNRTKFPYRAPDIDSFLESEDGRQYLSDATDPKLVKDIGIFDADKVAGITKRALGSGKGAISTSDNLVLMAILSGHSFFRAFFRERPAPDPFTPKDKVYRILEKREEQCRRMT